MVVRQCSFRVPIASYVCAPYNSVYHITDLPSFVSRDKVCFLDPHRAFVPGVDVSPRPGRMYDFVGDKLLGKPFDSVRSISLGRALLMLLR